MDMMLEFLMSLKFSQINCVVDPKVFKKESFVTKIGKECIMPLTVCFSKYNGVF